MATSHIRGVASASEVFHEQAHALASKLGVAVLDTPLTPRLEIGEQGLFLCMPDCSPMHVDFDASVKARCSAGMKKPAILRACKLKPGLRVLDATAGWGRDAAVLASTGAKVTMCEREPVMAALLEDGISRLQDTHALSLDLVSMDAKQYLALCEWRGAQGKYDVIYIDPMHPERSKSARVKKDLHALQVLLGADESPEALLKTAQAHALKRVVMKWPARKKALLTPSYSVTGKTVRFDVYVLSEA